MFQVGSRFASKRDPTQALDSSTSTNDFAPLDGGVTVGRDFTGMTARTFFIAAAMFGATSLYGYTTKRDLSRFGSFLMMGVIGVVIASLVNLLLGSTALQFVVSVIGIMVFTGLTAWETQAIKEQYAGHYDSEFKQKLAVFGAFSLYLSFVNVFQLLLHFTGQREE